MIGRRGELRPRRAPGRLRLVLRWLAITSAVVLVATAAVPAVGMVIAIVFWLLLAASLTVAAAALAGPARRAVPVVAGVLAPVLATATAWATAHRPRWLAAPFRFVSRATAALTTALVAAVVAVLPRWARRRRRDLVPAVALPRVPLAALPPAEPHRDRNPWDRAA